MRELVIAVVAVGLSSASTVSSATQPSINESLIKDVDNGSVPAVEQDLTKGADVNAIVGQYCSTALNTAGYKGNLPMIRLLLDHGANVNAVQKNCLTPLTEAAAAGHADAVALLIERGANPSLADGFGHTPLMEAAPHHADVLRILLDHGVDVNAKDSVGGTALMNAVISDNRDAALLLIEHGADVNARDQFDSVLDKAGSNPQMLALLRAHGAGGTTLAEQIVHAKIVGDAMSGDLNAVQQDLANGADINAHKSPTNDTPLSSAIEQDHDDVAGFLIEHGADVNEPDGAGISPLWMADEQENADLARALIAHGATVDSKLLERARLFHPKMLAVLQPASAPATAERASPAMLPVDTRKKVAVRAFIPNYNTNNLRVGYHADLPLNAECPAFWDKHGNPQGSGDWGGTAALVNGQLPPGLTFHEGSGTIDGTPRQPGDWHITIRLDGLYCYTKDNQEIDMDRSAPADRQWQYTLHVSP